MLDKVALDSNILASMFFKEDASQRALDAVTKPDLITLDLAVIEVGNVAWKQVTLFGKDRDLTLNALCRNARHLSPRRAMSSERRI